jgi:DNA polymerase II large subunit
MTAASPALTDYFSRLQAEVNRAYGLASQARAKGYDPEPTVEVALAANMAERVVGLISVIAPALANKAVVERIIELERQYGALDWRVALRIAEDVALERFCPFESRLQAMEVGIRTGFAYVTMGVVSSPLDGIVGVELKSRMDGRGQYVCLNFAGPIRNAGGTAAAVSAIIADYVRRKLGYDVYDATEDEVRRCMTELQDYHDRVTNLQYFPSPEEVDFLLKHLPVEIGGDASEDMEVSNYKDLPRVKENRIRSGYCLMLSSCVPLKAPKLWKQLASWGGEFGLTDWTFLEGFLKVQKAAKAKGAVAGEAKAARLAPDTTYMADFMAGRPLLGEPLKPGGFRLRYGRCRMSGFSAQAVHPATMAVLEDYIAIGTQLKVERPGKAASITTCTTIEGPTVRLDDGTVLRLEDPAPPREVTRRIVDILFLGDILIAYGDFANRAHPLVPAGYCEEWWAQELERAALQSIGTAEPERLAGALDLPPELAKALLQDPLHTRVDAPLALHLCRKLGIPLHPRHTYYWSVLSTDQLLSLLRWLGRRTDHRSETGTLEKTVLPLEPEGKRALELAGVPHKLVNGEYVVLDRDEALAAHAAFGLSRGKDELLALADQHRGKPALELINILAEVPIRDKAGTFIGSRMGRPEKAKLRELDGSPQVLFPVGTEGGRLRSFNTAVIAGTVTSDFPNFQCGTCNAPSPLARCPSCDTPCTARTWTCRTCGRIPKKCSHNPVGYSRQKLDIKSVWTSVFRKLKVPVPELVKGVRGTSSADHTPEHLAKGVLRARAGVYVNKDGTTRYDMTQLPMTHFRPREIGTPVARLRELGYVQDIHGQPLELDSQVCELKPQDVVLPSCDASDEEGADKALRRVAGLVDEELRLLYGLEPYYGLKHGRDLVGHLGVALAPHTSAGMVVRIIGFTRTQGFFAHPLLHAATRRDCDGDEACVLLLMDALLNFSKHYLPKSRGATMDAPLVLTSILLPGEVDDMAFDLDIAWKYPLELYEASLALKMPWEVKVPQLKSVLGKPGQYEGHGYTHETDDLNTGVRCSSYKTLPTMEDKLKGQMSLAEKLRSVDAPNVARMVIDKHFLKDAKGNLRKFGEQAFRCVSCNEKYRRPPLLGKCPECGGKLLFTVSEGNIVKYLEPMQSLAKKYNVPPYLVQTIELLQARIEAVFGKEKEKQAGLGKWFG